MPKRTARRPVGRRTGVEQLEPRQLLTTTPWIVAGDADPSAPDDLIIVALDPMNPAVLQVTVNGSVVGTRPVGWSGRIQIHGGRGDDVIRVEAPSLTRGFVFRGGPGNDVLVGGAGPDMLDGGIGDDVLHGGGGPDRLRGGAGHDTLIGGAGNDFLGGDRGADVLVAATGRDSLIGGGGRDRLFAAAASDRLLMDAADRFEESKRANPVFQPRNMDELRRVLRAGRSLGVTARASLGGGGIVGALPSVAGFMSLVDPAADRSGTNNQVAGVEEADIVKTDGRFVYAVLDGELLVIDADPASLSVLSRTPIPGRATGMFLGDGTVTVVSSEWTCLDPPEPIEVEFGPIDSAMSVVTVTQSVMMPVDRWWNSTSRVVVSVFDVADPVTPALVERTELEGSLLAARAIGGSVYLVVENDDALQAAVAGGPLPEFLTAASMYVSVGAAEGGLVTVARLSTTDARPGIDDAAVMVGMGSTVYASADTVYVAGTTWGGEAEPTTSLMAFSLGERIEHLASGSVPGFVPNQFAMDQAADGTFRIATQTGWWGRSASSAVHVLGRQGRDFVALGSVTGIAPGEDLKSVRFIGDQAYVVTFLQVDPLFVIDLADPRNPRITGELKIPGFSSYLHPMEDGRLFGIGQGDSWGTGKLSLFNVADPAVPTEVDAVRLGGPGGQVSSEAARDHHAFAWFETHGLLAVPVTETTWNREPVVWDDLPVVADVTPLDGGNRSIQVGEGFVIDNLPWHAPLPMHIRSTIVRSETTHMVKLFAVDRDAGFTHVIDVRHDSPVLRSLRIDDRLYTVSSTAIAVHQLGGSHEELARLVIDSNDPGTPWPWLM